MNRIFKNAKVELIGLFAWSLLAFAVINISVQLFHNILPAILIASFGCSFLNSFFLLAFYEFKLSIRKMLLFILLFTSLVLIFQMLFDSMIRLNNSFGGLAGYVLIGISLIAWNMTLGSIIRVIANAKK
ncbi:hypothetical protein [Reichenbachiella sp.]|uniref:hypothetical protein n=1 Tax=Reichenbachiella sp. TaxID=2184521 RepID=UPI003BB15D56